MGENTFRYSQGAPGVRLPRASPGDRAPGAAAEPAGSTNLPGAPAEPVGLRAALAGAIALISGRRGAQASRGVQATRGVQASRGSAPTGAVAGTAGVPAAPAVTYWRRRFVVLAVGLAGFAAAAWGLSEALRVQPGPGAAIGQHAAVPGRDGGPGGNVGGPAGQQRGVTAPGGTSRGGHGVGGSRSSRAAGPGAAAGSRPRAKPSARGFGGFKPAFCSWHSIVLSLSAAQVNFGPGQEPDFSLSVVSTQPADCSFNVGPGHLALVIKEGTATIWSSADCASGTGNLVTALRRGVPTVVSIGWARKTSSPGCTGPVREVPSGRYTGYAVDGSIVSPPVTFRLN